MNKQIKFLHLLAILALIAGLLTPLSGTVLAKGSDEAPKAHPAVLQMAQEHPNEKLKVIVQRKALENLPEQALERLSGKKTKELPLINGFAMEIPGKAVEALARSGGVRWISLDAPLISTGFLTSKVRDEFTTVSYKGNNGTVNWSNGWQEIGEADGPGSGSVRVSSSSLCPSGNCLRIKNNGASRQVNLKGTTSATLSFSYRRYREWDVNANVSLKCPWTAEPTGPRWQPTRSARMIRPPSRKVSSWRHTWPRIPRFASWPLVTSPVTSISMTSRSSTPTR